METITNFKYLNIMKNNKKDINFEWNKSIQELSKNRTKVEIKDNSILDIIKIIPQQPQVQYELNQQLQELAIVANRLGLYDAADFINSL